jgi:CheY-specific phosphatase CheX
MIKSKSSLKDSWSAEWRLRTKQLQDAGDQASQGAVTATIGITGDYLGSVLSSLTAKFRVVDDLLDALYESLPELAKRESFGDEYFDTM